MFFDLPEGLKIEKVKLELCKNNLNRTVIDNIAEAFNIRYTESLGNIEPLSFCVPFSVNYRNKRVKNINEKELRERRIIKLTRGTQVKYYIIHKISKVYEEDREYKQVECFSLGYELADKTISDLSLVSKNATQQLSAVLAPTNWTIGYVDSRFDIIYRGLEITSSSVLDAVIQIAQTFNALIVYNTVDRTVSFYDFESYGQYKGGSVKKGKLLKNIIYETDTTEYCTRLEVFGKDNISINSVNPTGTNYIEDYSSILYGFRRNPDKSVISSAPDISDSLANALLDYQELVESKQGQFQSLLDDLNNKTEDLITAEGELVDLRAELQVIEDSISTANATNQDPSPYIAQKNTKLSQISNKQSQINSIKSQIDSIRNDIAQLKDELDVNNNFTQDQLKEWNNHIVVRTWRNEYISDPQQLYEAGKLEMEKMREPKIVVNIGIVNLFKILTEYKNWDKMGLGDIIKIEVEDIGVKIRAKILEMEFDEEADDIKLTIGNIREYLNDEERFMKNLYNTISSSTEFDLNKYRYLDAASKANEVYQTINNIWDANVREIQASNNNEVEISRKGLRIYNPNNPNHVLIAQHGILAISNDGGNNWKNAITADRGIVAERLYGVITATNDLTVQNQAGTVEINATGFNVTDMNLSLVTSNKKSKININPVDGIQIQKNTGTTASPIWNNQVSINTDGDAIFGGNISIGSGNSIFKADINGIYLGHSTFSSAPFRVTPTGNLTATNADIRGTIRASSLFLNGVNVLVDSGARIGGQYIDKITTDQLVAGSAKISTALIENLVVGTNVTMGPNATISWNNVTNRPTNIENPSYITSTKITATTIETPTVIGGTITIGSGSSIFKADTNGIYLGSSSFGSAPFRVSPSGVLTATNATVTGTINATGGNFTGTVTGGIFQGSTFRTAPSGSRIEISDSGVRSYSGSSLHGVQILNPAYGGDSGRLVVYNNGSRMLTIHGSSSNSVEIYPWFTNLYIGSLQSSTRMVGNWYFDSSSTYRFDFGSAQIYASDANFQFTTTTTVGAAGPASPMPAQPARYMIVRVAGASYKIPLFNL